MKIGYRKKSFKKSISAKTTGHTKRVIKKAVNPSYGRNGRGWISNPQKSSYNKIYHKTTRPLFTPSRKRSTSSLSKPIRIANTDSNASEEKSSKKRLYRTCTIVFFIALVIPMPTSFKVAICLFCILYPIFKHFDFESKINHPPKVETPVLIKDTIHPIVSEKPIDDKVIIQDEVSAKYIKEGNVYRRADGESIKDEDIPILQELSTEDAKQYYANSPNPKFHRTLDEQMESIEFRQANSRLIGKLEDGIYESLNMTNSSKDKWLGILERSIKSYYDLKKYCYDQGKGGQLYFQDSWEYCHNTSNPCFEYVETLEEHRDYIINMRDVWKPTILNIIDKYNGDLIQKNIYDLVPDIKRSDVQKAIREMVDEKKVVREKASGSYRLSLMS